ncbi:MAG: hypothetical protein F4107_11925 [Gemmatimonadetes bacterium]|nr:hypothetical protein [Gemmatimonadota bacterium]
MQRLSCALALTPAVLSVGCIAPNVSPPPNQPPVVSGSIPDQRLSGPGEATTFDVSGHFSDSDGDLLRFTIASSDTSVVAVSMVGSAATLTGGASGGSGRVTVTARDPDGAEASATFRVVVNRTPVASVEIPPQRLWHGATSVDVDLTDLFNDPDGDTLIFAAASSDTAVVPVVLHPGAVASLAGPVRGKATVTVTARDPDGLAARSRFPVTVVENPDRAALVALYEAMGGPKWERSDNWLTDAPIGYWSWVGVNDEGRVSCFGNGARPSVSETCQHLEVDVLPNYATLAWPGQFGSAGGTFPPEFGSLEGLETLTMRVGLPPELWENFANLQTLGLYGLYGGSKLPSEMGSLRSLRHLYVSSHSGVAIPELGNLANLEYLHLSSRVAGPIPMELGKLTDLRWLVLSGGNQGPVQATIPPELGNIAKLEELVIAGHSVTGPIPAEFGNLSALRRLLLAGLHLSGPVPPELQSLTALEDLWIGSDCRWSIFDPEYLKQDPDDVCVVYEADLCAQSESLQNWLRGFRERGFPNRHQTPRRHGPPSQKDRRTSLVPGLCGVGVAHLTQAVQSREQSVPLVSGEPAALRLFGMSPPVSARFYLNGDEVHAVGIPEVAFDVGLGMIDGNGFPVAEPLIPASIVRPGLEFVVESSRGRFPAEGRQTVDVREIPTLNLTVVPVLAYGTGWVRGSTYESTMIALADSMADDPEGDWRLRGVTDLLPVAAIRVTRHAPIVLDYDHLDVRIDPNPTLTAVAAARLLEGGTGYWMGLDDVLPYGSAYAGGYVSESYPDPVAIAHELGHNFNLGHSGPESDPWFDSDYPHPQEGLGSGGTLGAWGYALQHHPRIPGLRWTPVHRFQHIDPLVVDLMGQSGGYWISDYHFTKALEYRLRTANHAAFAMAARSPVQSLLVWGGTDSIGTPYLKPVFVVDAPPGPPEARGPWTIEGRDSGGRVLFSLPFTMPEIADAGAGAGGFAYALPVRPGWEDLASVTLSGPGGRATLDGSTDRPLSIYRDGEGKVRAILQGDPMQADGAPSSGPLASVALDVVTSRGIPSAAAWRR